MIRGDFGIDASLPPSSKHIYKNYAIEPYTLLASISMGESMKGTSEMVG